MGPTNHVAFASSSIHRCLNVECAKKRVIFFLFTLSVFQVVDVCDSDKLQVGNSRDRLSRTMIQIFLLFVRDGQQPCKQEFQKRLTLHTEDQRRSHGRNGHFSVDRSIDRWLLARHLDKRLSNNDEIQRTSRSLAITPRNTNGICPRFQEHENTPCKEEEMPSVTLKTSNILAWHCTLQQRS